MIGHCSISISPNLKGKIKIKNRIKNSVLVYYCSQFYALTFPEMSFCGDVLLQDRQSPNRRLNSGLLLFYLYQALFSHKMFELELFQAGTHADGF